MAETPATSYRPRRPLAVVWGLYGALPAWHLTPPLRRLPWLSHLTVRWESTAPVTLVQEARVRARWQVMQAVEATLGGGFLLKPLTPGVPVRLRLEGAGEGVVEVLATRG
jgi:hypothetical protein